MTFFHTLTCFILFAMKQGLEVDHLVIDHLQVNQAPKTRRRTYRAHGRINRKLSAFSSFKRLDAFLKAFFSPFHSVQVEPMPHRDIFEREGVGRSQAN